MRVILPTVLGLASLATAQTSNSTDCVSVYVNCLDLGGADNSCESENAICKNLCANSYGSCLESGIGDVACMTEYNSCLDGFAIFTTAANSAGKDCVSVFSDCHDSGTADNTCNSGNAQCKDKCSTIYGTCLTSGDADNASCMTQYNNCLDAFSVFATAATSQSIDCVSMFSACHDNLTADNTCDSYSAQCKDKCSVMYGTCLSSGAANDTLCMGQYNNCLDSFTPSISVDCVSNFTICRDNGIEANTCASYNAQCKDKCSVNYSTCLSSGDADDSACLTQYDGCLVSFTTVAGSSDCVSKYSLCEDDGTTPDNTCAANNAVCKTDCSTSYSTCLSSGDSSLAAPCLSQYNSCLDSFTWNTNTTITGQDCVSKYMNCDGEDNSCSAANAQCKNSCSVSYDDCRSSGDSSLDEECLIQYDNCLVNFNSVITTPDCASAYLSCDAADNDCEADLAQCKNTCGVARDTCETSGDESLYPQCLKQYDSCLVNFTVAKAAIGEDCVASYLSCDEADNVCFADNAQCKNKCAEVYDTCNSSGDNSTAAACLNLYDTCLVSFSANDTIAAGQDCATEYTACDASGVADNVCNSYFAQCKNKCATADDTCRSSGDETLVSMCDSMYNRCLDPVMNTNITTNATAVVNATAMVNSTSSYVLPSKTASLNTTYSTRVNLPSGYISSIPTASANGTGIFANATSSASAKLAVVTPATASSGFALPSQSTVATPSFANATSTYIPAQSTALPTEIPSSALAVVSASSDVEDETCES
ncbi:uncharacterized protein LY89DRAFT_61781 [Mollisia scopiformis]|uniref:Uncharacterized protein n=1 Tax=Mollisia scopiformis TaxID=149040 RepID=A0A194XCC2_MOLSC|nr:uncharacterized protein LY89DRAFT_61781 [Mollisia scopiformis]KUJ17806.1 hypothetical protein LY89DRAFT_61781 [Mollisia scopiformis]